MLHIPCPSQLWAWARSGHGVIRRVTGQPVESEYGAVVPIGPYGLDPGDRYRGGADEGAFPEYFDGFIPEPGDIVLVLGEIVVGRGLYAGGWPDDRPWRIFRLWHGALPKIIRFIGPHF